MTNKTPFEIRLDVLKMAQEMLDAERRTQEKYFEKQVELLISSNPTSDTIVNFLNSTPPIKSYNEADVLSRSAALYSFIDNKTRT